ncbi:MAG: hypothetical protein JSV20_03060 [Candidatus Bathyarchaeota archaeon]|nr:MAG: hypothetical protein JSV20_03060 [Candidatus Bathyarchaeota archaeon]
MSFCTIKDAEEFKILKEIMRMLRRGGIVYSRRLEFQSDIDEKTEDRVAQKRKAKKTSLFSLPTLLNGKSEESISQTLSLQESVTKQRDEHSRDEYFEGGSPSSTHKDLEDFLREYKQKGYIDMKEQRITITSKGARILGRGYLRKIIENLTKKNIGAHIQKESGYGSRVSRFSRPYDLGDVYERINIEKTFLNALEKNRQIDQINIEDFEVYEPLYYTKMNVGIIVDESGSMNNRNKIDAALEATLALSELMSTEHPQDILRIFIFSEFVKQITPWDITNIIMPMHCTDICAGIRAYRRAVVHEDGNKQTFLITDCEPNFEEGRHIGFKKASLNILKEASRCRMENITLNLIMLDETKHLKELAHMIAKRNLGKVVFTDPKNLGEAVIEDYLTCKTLI